jgi:hypothetical protein
MAGAYTDQRLNLSKLWEGPRKKCQGFKPDPGNPAVRDYRGASGNVSHGGNVHPSCNRKSGKRKPPTYSGARPISIPIAIAAPAVAGDLTSIELDSSGKAIAVKKEPGKLALIPDIAGKPNKGFGYAAIYQVPPNSIDISKGINVMRGRSTPTARSRSTRDLRNTDTFFTSSAALAR